VSGTLARLLQGERALVQTVAWHPGPWRSRLGDLPVLTRLQQCAARDGIRRTDVVGAAEDPVGLLVAAMVWGFGPRGYGPARTERMLATPGVVDVTRRIVDEVRASGPGPGFSALFKAGGGGCIRGLGVAMGSKVLYFAGCWPDCVEGIRPLV
jgi:hypothetical protein